MIMLSDNNSNHGGWNIEFHSLPSHTNDDDDDYNDHKTTCTEDEGIILTSISLSTLFANDGNAYHAFTGIRSTTTNGRNENDEEEKDANDVKVRAAKVALADYTARTLSNLLPIDTSSIKVQTMSQARHSHSTNKNNTNGKLQRGRNKLLSSSKKKDEIPYVLERTDCMVVNKNKEGSNEVKRVEVKDDCHATLQFFLHVTFLATSDDQDDIILLKQQTSLNDILSSTILQKLQVELTSNECYTHVACVVLQNVLRNKLQPPKESSTSSSASSKEEEVTEKDSPRDDQKQKRDEDYDDDDYYLNAVSFISDNSLLPRKSGRSMLPMSSPPSVPFTSPRDSDQLTRIVTLHVGKFWRRYLNDDGSVKKDVRTKDAEKMNDRLGTSSSMMMDTSTTTENGGPSASSSGTVTMRGMIIPRGVTLIVGGGYHGKSTLLQAITMGIYDTIPYDGRERCVTHQDAISIRAEDGRYVHNTNVSAFISNLPSGKSINGASISSKQDTSRFSTKDASGSTSQAANVIEAIECGASSLLVDEDVSAANFMARDGRMRAMIMDEPITPLLYRVNGLFLAKEHQVSTVVVVGGVGEWLDVADAVVLMKDYVAYDGLKKAQSVSYQFSYGHVQYAGRGVVHRLPWEVKEEKKNKLVSGGEDEQMNDDVIDDRPQGVDEKKLRTTTLSPLRRKPELNCIMNKFKNAAVHLLEGGRLWFYSDDENILGSGCDDDGEDDGMVDMSKCSQLVGNASEQLYGCGVCVLWLIKESLRHPEDDLPDLLDRMEVVLNQSNGGGGGMNTLIASLQQSQAALGSDTTDLSELLSSHDIFDLWSTVGYAFRPRRHEVSQALTRMRGLKFDILPDKPKAIELSPEDEAIRLEEESKKRALAELWANRRKK